MMLRTIKASKLNTQNKCQRALALHLFGPKAIELLALLVVALLALLAV